MTGESGTRAPELARGDRRLAILLAMAMFVLVVDTSVMNAAELTEFNKLRPAGDNYFHWDDQVVAWLSDGTHESFLTTVESINGGDAGAGYSIVLDLADAIQKSATDRAAQLRVDQGHAQTRAIVLLSVVGLADPPTGANGPPALACSVCGSANVPLTSLPVAVLLGSATERVASPAVEITFAVVEAR